MHRPKILIVDDDAAIVKLVRANLQANQYDAVTAMNGRAAIEVMERDTPDLVLLDIMMPEMDGFEVCRRLREWTQVPIIMLTARGDERDKVRCLDMGADDYISKPFGVGEMLARVRAVMRRSQYATTRPTAPSFRCEGLVVNFAERKAVCGSKELKLTPTEYNLLQELALNPGKVLTYTHLLQRVWGPEYGDEREYLHVFVNRLRAKMGTEAGGESYITTVPGVGYEMRRTG